MDGEDQTHVVYDPSLDRIDVAIKAILLMRRRGMWPQLEDLGVDRAGDARCIEQAVLELDTTTREADLMRLVALCPVVLEAAENLLWRYWLLSAISFAWFHARRVWR